MESVFPENLSREELLFLAKLAEEAGKYEEMQHFMKKIVQSSTPNSKLTGEERGLFVLANKNVAASHRAVWRTFCLAEEKEKKRENSPYLGLVKTYKSSVESKLSQECATVLEILNNNLIPSVPEGDNDHD